MTRIRRGASAAAVVAVLIGMAGAGPGGPAPAVADAGGVDQITGQGPSDSQVTTSWSAGLIGADNKTVVAKRDPNSPQSFMYDDFKNLELTVSQTQSLTHQVITVNWSGAQPTVSSPMHNYLQIMECYGDQADGPAPENCEFGASGLSDPSVTQFQGPTFGRRGSLCAAGTPSPANPLRVIGGGLPNGCDPGEAAFPAHADPLQSGPNRVQYSVPFVPAGTDVKAWDTGGSPSGDITSTLNYFSKQSSNEIQIAQTRSDGTGQQAFQLLTGVESQGLGCGQLEASGKPRDCWLVIVPRANYLPNGFQFPNTSIIPGTGDSPLGASTWAQRIQIHLGFQSIGVPCPIGSQERATVGSELVAHAVFSWQLALNQASHCQVIYGYGATPQATDVTQLASEGGAGLAFTDQPLDFGGAGPPLVYAPVAITALTLPFRIDIASTGGERFTPIKLTPRLLAKMLTQSYKDDLPDFNAPGITLRSWAKKNPVTVTHDPEFQQLNPGVFFGGATFPLGPLLTEDHSPANALIWSWIQSDPAARAWLNGAPDENGMVVNPDYRTLHLGSPPAIDSYPRADPTCAKHYQQSDEKPPGVCTLQMLPYVADFDEAAARVQGANSPSAGGWNPLLTAPDGTSGWYETAGPEPAGTRFLSAVTGSPDLATYSLVPATLCLAGGNGCAPLSAASVSAAVDAATPDSSGLLHVDPANPAGHDGTAAYPLVQVTYAAVRTNQDPSALRDYASLLDYIAGPGQTPGVQPGQLPRGYLALPDALRAQTRAVADTLRADADAPNQGPGLVAQPNPPSSGQGGANPSDGGGKSPSGHSPGSRGPSPNHSGNPTGVNPSQEQLPVQLAGKPTPRQSLGALRWALLAILLAGLIGAVSAPLIRRPPTALRRLVGR